MKILTVSYSEQTREVSMLRRDFISSHPSLNVRDLRPIFSPLQVSTILPRIDVVIVNLGFIKCALTQSAAYFVVHRNESGVLEICDKITSHAKSSERQEFVLYTLEKIFEAKLAQMRTKMSLIEQETERILSQIRKNFSERYLEDLLLKKKQISKNVSRISEIRDAVEEVLEDAESVRELTEIVSSVKKSDEELTDLGGLQSARKNDEREALSMEIASILENFIEQVEDVDGHVTRLRESVEDTEEFLTLRLNARRTATLRADLLATITTLILSFLAVVVGLYGTNIRNGFEQNPEAFTRLQFFLVGFFCVSLAVAFYGLRKKRLF